MGTRQKKHYVTISELIDIMSRSEETVGAHDFYTQLMYTIYNLEDNMLKLGRRSSQREKQNLRDSLKVEINLIHPLFKNNIRFADIDPDTVNNILNEINFPISHGDTELELPKPQRLMQLRQKSLPESPMPQIKFAKVPVRIAEVVDKTAKPTPPSTQTPESLKPESGRTSTAGGHDPGDYKLQSEDYASKPQDSSAKPSRTEPTKEEGVKPKTSQHTDKKPIPLHQSKMSRSKPGETGDRKQKAEKQKQKQTQKQKPSSARASDQKKPKDKPKPPWR